MATTVTLKPNAIDLSGSTSGTTTLQATAVAGTTTVTLPAATDTLVGKATTDTLTNKTLTAPVIASANITTALTLTGASGTSGQVLTSAGSGLAPTWGSASATAIINGTSNVSINSSNGAITASTNGTSAFTVDTSQNLQFNSGYGSVATAYGCRAWVNFNGTGTVAIRASGNVSSITDNGVGDYTVNFTTAMPDVNYAMVGTSGSVGNFPASLGTLATNTTSVQVLSNQHNSGAVDRTFIMVSIIR